MSAEAPVAPGARCALHPAEPAAVTCARCGAFACGACLDALGRCRRCVVHLERAGAPAGTAVAAAVCGALGLGCVPLALVGVVLGALQLRAIARGDAPARGRAWARAGVLTGAVGLALAALALLLGVALLARR